MFYDDLDNDGDGTHLPNYFVTCFDESKLTKYRQAIDEYAEKNPQHGLDIDTSGKWNPQGDPAFLCYDRGDLNAFWEIFEAL